MRAERASSDVGPSAVAATACREPTARARSHAFDDAMSSAGFTRKTGIHAVLVKSTPGRPARSALGRKAVLRAKPRSSGERRISTCSCRATASSRSRATRRRARRRFVALSVRPWRSGGSMRRGLCPPPGRAADQGAALRRRFAGGGRPEGDCAVRESRAGAEPLPRRQCRPDATRACGAAGNRADIAAACAHAFARRGSLRKCSRTKKVAQKRS